MSRTSTLIEEIDNKIGEVRTDSLDLSFGEIINLHHNKEIKIDPEYQRLFRWSPQQKSRLIESILIELPIPQIVLIEDESGIYELIDGLQRISSVIQFVKSDEIELLPLVLEGCDLIKSLNGKSFADLPLSLQLKLKRTPIRSLVVKRQSKSFLKYEMFKRLNTGGSILSPQEVRNCSSRMAGRLGVKFYSFLQKMTKYKPYRNTTDSMAFSDEEQRGREELVLRFLALKNGIDQFRGSIRDWLDTYMEGVILGSDNFDFDKEEKDFKNTFAKLSSVMGEGAFVKYRQGAPIGGLAPAYFEAVSIGFHQNVGRIDQRHYDAVKSAIVSAVQSENFRRVTGPGANNKTKMRQRISLVDSAIKEAVA